MYFILSSDANLHTSDTQHPLLPPDWRFYHVTLISIYLCRVSTHGDNDRVLSEHHLVMHNNSFKL